MTFVWPYIKGPSFWNHTRLFNELEWSVKTVKHFYKDARCVVIGDKPDFDVEWIDQPKIETSKIDVRHRDIIEKLETACGLFDEFVLMYDDVYFLRPITKKDFRPTALCKIEDLNTYDRGKGGLLYTRLWKETYKKVAEITTDLYDWETHMPRLLNSDRVMWLINVFDLKNKGFIITSLYGAMYLDDPVLLSEDDTIRSHVDIMGPSVDLDKEFSRKFLIIDDNACTPSMIEKIKKLIP